MFKKIQLAEAASVGSGNGMMCSVHAMHKLSESNEAAIRIKRAGRARPLYAEPNANSKSRQIACAKG
jgi:hypothetical protein